MLLQQQPQVLPLLQLAPLLVHTMGQQVLDPRSLVLHRSSLRHFQLIAVNNNLNEAYLKYDASHSLAQHARFSIRSRLRLRLVAPDVFSCQRPLQDHSRQV